jgi:hypothetical protein
MCAAFRTSLIGDIMRMLPSLSSANECRGALSMAHKSICSWLLVGGALFVLVAGCRPARPPEGVVTLNWMAPAENEDGSAIVDLAGYRIYWGQSPGGPYPGSVMIEDVAQTSYRVEGLDDGTWYFVVTAVNADFVESRLSNEVHVVIVDGAPVENGNRVAERAAGPAER